MTASPVSPQMRRFIMLVDRFVLFVTRRWLLLANVFIFIFAGLPFLAPVLMHLGWTALGNLIYKVYSFSCHQLAYRTYFFFGAQPVYTVEDLQHALGVTNPANDVFFWRDFIGNTQVGYKMAWCERDAAIYVAILAAGMGFGWLRARVKPLNWRIYLFLIAPMAIDGLTQLFGFRESDANLRLITGALFGAGSVWLVYPYVEEAMRDAYAQAKYQYERGRMRDQEEKRIAYGE